jgi:hypothetical protein
MSARNLTLGLAALALLIVSASTLIYYVGIYTPARNRAEATAIAGTHIASMSATGTAQAVATMQVYIAATATVVKARQSSYDEVIQSRPVLVDSLAAPGHANWASGQGCTFIDGSYQVSEARRGFFWPCSAQGTFLNNFAYQVHMRIIKGDAGGIIFRADAAIAKFYVFRVAQDGTYDMYYYPDSTGKSSQKLAEGYSSLIASGIEKDNQLTVIARGSTIFLYINGKYLTGIQHKGLASGLIGVIADSSEQPTEVEYSQVRVWKL